MMNTPSNDGSSAGLVDCMTKTSSPRTFSSILTNVSPSGNELTVHFPNGIPMDSVIRSAKEGLDVPLKIFTLNQVAQPCKTKKPPSAGGLVRSLTGHYQPAPALQAQSVLQGNN